MCCCCVCVVVVVCSAFFADTRFACLCVRRLLQGGKLLYGMDKELAEKQAAKWDPKLEAEARQWIEAVTGMEIGADLHEGLKSGEILVTLVNTIQPGILKAPSKMSAPFKQMENIGNFSLLARSSASLHTTRSRRWTFMRMPIYFRSPSFRSIA